VRGSSKARIGSFESTHLLDVPDKDLTVIKLPSVNRMASPTLELGPTQCFPSAPVTESDIAPVTSLGKKKKNHALAFVVAHESKKHISISTFFTLYLLGKGSNTPNNNGYGRRESRLARLLHRTS
jgi:hypothetical protein